MFPAPKVDDIISVMNTKGYSVFKNTKGHDLNIVGIRTESIEEEKF